MTAMLAVAVPQLSKAGSPPSVPASYQDLYNTLNTDLSTFNTTLNGVWNGSTAPVLFAESLANANASPAGPNLPTSGGYSLELQELQALGIKAVVVEVGFPMLYQPFFTYVAAQPGYTNVNYTAFATYYQQLAAAVHAANLKLIVDCQVMLANDVQAGWSPVLGQYYATLDWTQYQTARAQAAQQVLQVMNPDYLLVLQEPDSEATQSGQTSVNTVSGAASLLNQILSTIGPQLNTKVGAGVDNNLVDIEAFAQSFAGVNCSASQPCVNAPGLDFIDLQIYPMNIINSSENFQQNAFTVAGIAASAGKPLTMSQAWMWKLRNSEYTTINYDSVRARDPFSFWAPLDTYFEQLMENFANYTQMLFMAPDGPGYMFAYLTYNNSTANMSAGQILSAAIIAAGQANQTGSFTTTGVAYYNSLVVPPDTTPPSPPAILTANSGSPTTASLSWAPSTDNVGVTAYNLLRDNTLLTTTNTLMYQDSGLTANTTYTYEVIALDLAGNMSAPAVVNITTQSNSVPPNPPTNLAATAIGTREAKLTWTPPTGSVPVSQYLLFRGIAPACNLVQVQTIKAPSTSFTQGGLIANTTYCYGLKAKGNGLVSAMSNVAMVTIP